MYMVIPCTCFAQVNDLETQKKIIAELEQFDALKKKYSLLQNENLLLSESYRKLTIDYRDLDVDFQKQFDKFNRHKERADKRGKRVALATGLLATVVSTFADREDKKPKWGVGIPTGLSVYLTLRILL